MVIPQGVNIPMPRPFGGIPPAISKTPLGEDAAGGELITVSLVGEIGPITQYLEMFEALDTANENDQVRIVLDTPGGDVYTSQQIVGRMESCKAKVTTVASGLVASAGTFIWLYGQKQEIERWARFMFHSSLHGDWGKSLAIQENAAELVKFMAQILSNAERRGILIAAEVQRILKGKGDVEISAAEARKRLAILAQGDGDDDDPGDPNPNDDPGNGEGDDDGQPPAEGDDNGNPSAKKLTKKTTVKKSKKRISQDPNGDPEPGGDDDDGGDDNGDEGDDNGNTGEDAPPSEGGESIESMFAAICDANGVEPETTETTTTENEPVETPSNKRKPAKKSKKRRSEAGEGGEPNPATGDDDDEDDDDDGAGEGEGEPGEGGDNDEGDEGEGEPPSAKRGKKGKSKKRRAQGDGDDGGEGEPPAEGGDDNGDEGAAGEPPAEGDDTTSVADLFDTICEENGVTAPPPDEGDGGDGDAGDDDGDDGDDGTAEGDDNGEGDDGAPSAKCGGKKKSKKPAKKRRGEEPGQTEITEPGEADQNSHLRQVPSSRHW